jgi:hypothetical protein
MSKDYKVGKGRPPLHSRFKPGQSGNPKGRPKGVKSDGDLLDQILSCKVTIREGGSVREVTVKEAILIGMAAKAMKGDPRAAAYLHNLRNTCEGSPAERVTSRNLAADADAFIDSIHALAARMREEP